jgi:hypothetical protein
MPFGAGRRARSNISPAQECIVFTRGQNFCIAKASIRSPSQARVKTEGQKLSCVAGLRPLFRGNRDDVTDGLKITLEHSSASKDSVFAASYADTLREVLSIA